MPSTATIAVSVTVNDGIKNTVADAVAATVAVALGQNGKRETVSLAAASFTALSAPAGAKGVLILAMNLVSCTLKGVTGDTGITAIGASAGQLPIFLPLTGTPSIGILNSGALQTVEVIWF